MKTKIFSTLILFASLMVFVGCDSKDEKDLEGTWVWSEQGMIILTITLDGDGTYDMQMADLGAGAYSDHGTWEVSDGKLITTSSLYSTTDEIPFEIDGDTLTLTQEGESITMTRQ